ncbi:hypothetical protein DL93DRAFT_2088524 [Clavulina sp. PMI_390]|nr:hypothetical protein DL93DRAFT_2088524 [Clavulina sp. PMI_390]
MLSSWSRRAQQAEEQGTMAEFEYKGSLGVSRATQVGNEDAEKAPHEAKSDARKAWASEVIASRDEALECCRPDPLPNPFETSAELLDHLVRLKEGTNIIRSLDGIRGNQALRARNATEEGRALRLEQNKNHSRTMRLKHQTEIERLQAEYDAADEDARTDEKFLCLRWDNIFTTSKAVELLARPNFEDAKPSDSALSLAQCTSCGDVCIVSRNTKHCCPSASNPKKSLSIPEMNKAGMLKSMTVLTPHELLSHPLCRPLPADFFEQTGLVQEPSIDALPLGVVIPLMSPPCQAAWDASFVIYHPDDPTESARFQAHDTLARLVLGLDRDQDVIFENVYDLGIPLGLVEVLPGSIPHACIVQVDCAQCPRTLVTVSQPSGSKRNKLDYKPRENHLVHLPRMWYPDTMSLLPADPGLLQRVGDSLRAHTAVGGKHSGTIGENYPDFWHLPLMIKRAHIYACFFHNTKLGKAKGGDSLLGNATMVVNWQSPS